MLLTGIGGQGIQLAGKTLATAAIAEGRQVMVFGSYGASMRGGNTDATIVIGDGPLMSPPTVSRAWYAIGMHHQFWPPIRDRLRPGGLTVIDTSVFLGDVGAEGVTVVPIDASTMAIDLGSANACSMVALGALAAATGLVSLDSLVAATASVLPPYRASHAASNAEAVRAGFATVDHPLAPAWDAALVGGAS